VTQSDIFQHVSKFCYRACSNVQLLIRHHVRNHVRKFFKWPSTGCLDTYLSWQKSCLLTCLPGGWDDIRCLQLGLVLHCAFWLYFVHLQVDKCQLQVPATICILQRLGPIACNKLTFYLLSQAYCLSHDWCRIRVPIIIFFLDNFIPELRIPTEYLSTNGHVQILKRFSLQGIKWSRKAFLLKKSWRSQQVNLKLEESTNYMYIRGFS